MEELKKTEEEKAREAEIKKRHDKVDYKYDRFIKVFPFNYVSELEVIDFQGKCGYCSWTGSEDAKIELTWGRYDGGEGCQVV